MPRSITHPLVAGLRNPVVVNDDSIREYVDVERTPFDETVRRALGPDAAGVAGGPGADADADGVRADGGHAGASERTTTE
jgi:hypothetical protein